MFLLSMGIPEKIKENYRGPIAAFMRHTVSLKSQGRRNYAIPHYIFDFVRNVIPSDKLYY